MKRLTITTIGELLIGDRFYRFTDRKQSVWSKVNHEPKITEYRTYKNFALKDGDKKEQAFMSDTKVVFLRHAESNKATI